MVSVSVATSETTSADASEPPRSPKVSDSDRYKLKTTNHNVHDAVNLVKSYARARFVETVDLAIRLGVDPRKPNQSIKSVAKLPHGTGKSVRVAVFAMGDDVQAAKDAGADIVGGDDLIKIIQSGDISFDRAIATPEMMIQVSKIGKV